MNGPQSFNSVTNDSRENNPLNPPLLRRNSSGAPFAKGESMIRQQYQECPVCNAQLNNGNGITPLFSAGVTWLSTLSILFDEKRQSHDLCLRQSIRGRERSRENADRFGACGCDYRRPVARSRPRGICSSGDVLALWQRC